jgi:CubicO group peptidase (beta-lactamase class C family)
MTQARLSCFRFPLFTLFACSIALLGAVPAESQVVVESPAAAGGSSALATWIESHVPEAMAKAKMPGFSIAVVQDGETIYAEGFGARDAELNLPVTVDTLFGIGSITKSFVAIGIMQLVEAGEVALEDPVGRHIPFELGRPEAPITIHHLLTHSLGLPSLATSSVALYRGLGVDLGVPLSSAADFYRLVNGAGHELLADPGERFFYHNAAWRMLAHVIQVRSGMPFHDYMKEKIIDPLGMTRTTLDVSDFVADADHAVLHRRDAEGNAVATRFPYPDPDDNPGFSFLSGAGGIVSSVTEMTRYLNAQIAAGAGGDEGLVSSGAFREIQALHIRRADGYYGAYGYGYGLSITPDFLGHKMIGHGGSIVASTAYMAFLPELRAGVIMMGNASGMSYAPIAESLFALLLGQEPEAVIPALRIRRQLGQLVGRYQTYRGIEQLEVLEKGGMLYLKSTSRLTGRSNEVPLIPEDSALRNTLFYTWSLGRRSPVEFRLLSDGRIDLYLGRYVYHKGG